MIIGDFDQLFRKDKLFLAFEYVERNLLEVLEQQPRGLEVISRFKETYCNLFWDDRLA